MHHVPAATAADRGDAAGHSLVSIYKYPIKGLSPQQLDEVTLEAGNGFPGDRLYAFARPHGAYRPGLPNAVSKQEFFMLAKDARLAGLSTTVAEDGHSLTVRVRDHTVFEADLDRAAGRRAAEVFFGRVLGCDEPDLPVLAQERGRRFTDVSVASDQLMEAVSVINLASLRELERKWGASIDPLRFRANLYVDLLDPFVERDLLDSVIQIGPVRLHMVLHTKRCAATEVNPHTAQRDLSIPRMLVQDYGDAILGIYGQVVAGGTLRPGQMVKSSDD